MIVTNINWCRISEPLTVAHVCNHKKTTELPTSIAIFKFGPAFLCRKVAVGIFFSYSHARKIAPTKDRIPWSLTWPSMVYKNLSIHFPYLFFYDKEFLRVAPVDLKEIFVCVCFRYMSKRYQHKEHTQQHGQPLLNVMPKDSFFVWSSMERSVYLLAINLSLENTFEEDVPFPKWFFGAKNSKNCCFQIP